MWKAVGLLFSVIAGAASLAACAAYIPDGLGPGPPCEMAPDGSLLLRGATDEKMLACMTRLAPTHVTKIVVNSLGGDVTTAMKVADIIAPLKPHIVVHGQCNSSCANYFLPMASRITLLPNAIVLLHGSIDEATVARANNRTAFDMQAEFTARHGIHRGWLLYRTREDWDAQQMGNYLTGAPKVWFWAPHLNLKAVMVEERFMRSCLKGVEITPWENTPAQRIYREEGLQRAFVNQGVYPSGTLACGPGQ